MMDWNWAGLSRPESRRNSSSVRMVLSERLAAAGSMPILMLDSLGVMFAVWERCMYLSWMGVVTMLFGVWCMIAK